MDANISWSTASGNCSAVNALMKHYYLPVMYTTIFVVGLVGNVISIILYLTKMRPWKSSSIIMLNLAITDLLYMFSLPFLALYYVRGDSWTMGDFMCRFVRFGFHFNMYGSILFLTCLSMFRYVVVVHPLKMTQIQRKSVGCIACLVVWAISAVEIVPMLTMINMEVINNKTECLDFASNDPENVWWYSWLLTTLGYLLPLVVVCICYYRIVVALRSGPHTQSPHRTRAQRLTVLVLVVFVVCFMPFHILRAARVATRKWATSCTVADWVHAIYIISRPVAGLNSLFNLPLYTMAGDKFQQAFFSIFKIKLCISRGKSHVSVVTVSRRDFRSS